MDIVFCGMAPGNKSARVGAYYAHKGNRFWRVLKEVGLTDVELKPEEFPRLSEYNIGITDLFKDQCGMDHMIDVKKFDREFFNNKILKASPRKLAFTSKNVGSVYFGVSPAKISFGLQKEKLGETLIYVLPGTSPANSGNWGKNPDYIEYWRELL